MNPDQPVRLKPAHTDRQFWKRIFSVALDDLAELVAPERLIVCEGNMHRDGKFDAYCYSKIFGNEFPDTEFVSAGGAAEVQKNAILISALIESLFENVEVISVIDRDDRNEVEILEAKARGTRVLTRRHLESYLFDDEILERLLISRERVDLLDEVKRIKHEGLAACVDRGRPRDDMKSAADQFYVALRRLLDLRQAGSTVDAFCRYTLVPLVTPDTRVYQELKRDIFCQ